MINNPYPISLRGFEAQVEACRTWDLKKEVGRIKTDTLIVAGKDDILVPFKCSEFIHQQIRNSKLVAMEDCGHMLQIERPVEFADIIIPFISS